MNVAKMQIDLSVWRFGQADVLPRVTRYRVTRYPADRRSRYGRTPATNSYRPVRVVGALLLLQLVGLVSIGIYLFGTID